MSQLIADCVYYILEYLEDEEATLFSCLIVSRLWCEVAVEILWRNGLRYEAKSYITLVACLPRESIETLHGNGIFIQAPTSKPPMFNYAAFCKSLSIYAIQFNVKILIENHGETISTQDFKNFKKNILILMQEILKLFMSQISSLKSLYINSPSYVNTLTTYPGAENCLRNL